MASATKVTRNILVPTTVDEVQLNMSPTEAKTLMAILNNVGGCPANSPRGYADKIRIALFEAGVENTSDMDQYVKSHSNIMFKNSIS